MKRKLDAYTQIHATMGNARQLIKGSTVDKLAHLMHSLPQRIEDGRL